MRACSMQWAAVTTNCLDTAISKNEKCVETYCVMEMRNDNFLYQEHHHTDIRLFEYVPAMAMKQTVQCVRQLFAFGLCFVLYAVHRTPLDAASAHTHTHKEK